MPNADLAEARYQRSSRSACPIPADVETYREFRARDGKGASSSKKSANYWQLAIREACYDLPAHDQRPVLLLGRLDEQGQPLLLNDQPITTDHITAVRIGAI